MRGTAWLGTLKARLMLLWALLGVGCVLVATITVLGRVEARAEQAIADPEAEHMANVAAVVGRRVVLMQPALRLFADHLPGTVHRGPEAARGALTNQTGVSALIDTTFVANATGDVLALQDDGSVTTRALNLGQHEYFVRTVARGVLVLHSHDAADIDACRARADATLYCASRGGRGRAALARPDAAPQLAVASAAP